MNFGEVAGAVTTEVGDISNIDHPHDRKICYSIEILSLEWPNRLIYPERKGLCSTLSRRLCSSLLYKTSELNPSNWKLIRPNEGMAKTVGVPLGIAVLALKSGGMSEQLRLDQSEFLTLTIIMVLE